MLVIHMNFCIMNDECLGIFRFRECLNINWTLFPLVLLEAVSKGIKEGYDLVLCDTSGRKLIILSLSMLLLRRIM